MANIKRITLDWRETSITVYYISRREADNYRMDDSDGDFAASPADPYQELSEDAVIKGRYEADESRVAWDDGRYTFTFYKQAGGSPVPASDTIIATGEMVIKDDLEVYLGDLAKEATLTAMKGSGFDTNTDSLKQIKATL